MLADRSQIKLFSGSSWREREPRAIFFGFLSMAGKLPRSPFLDSLRVGDDTPEYDKHGRLEFSFVELCGIEVKPSKATSNFREVYGHTARVPSLLWFPVLV